MIIDIAEKLYISTIAPDAAETAREFGLGLEIAEFCTASNMDAEFGAWDKKAREEMRGINRFTFHAPFNELCPAAVDPLIVDVAKKRYEQAYELMTKYGITTMIAHSGFVPALYDDRWFAAKSTDFWKKFLKGKPAGFKLFLENTFERSPMLLHDIVCAVGDSRLGLCLDTGHAALSGSDAPVMEWVRQSLPFLRHVHLHNNYGSRDSHNALDDGIADIAEVVRASTEKAPGVTFTVETRCGKTSAEWLSRSGFLRPGEDNG